jgi:hypothetical protein
MGKPSGGELGSEPDRLVTLLFIFLEPIFASGQLKCNRLQINPIFLIKQPFCKNESVQWVHKSVFKNSLFSQAHAPLEKQNKKVALARL